MSNRKYSTLKLSNNRLYIAFGTFLIAIGMKLVFHTLDMDTTRNWMLYGFIKDMASIAIIWLGQGLIFDKKHSHA